MNPVQRSLSLVRWDAFATLTFASNRENKPLAVPSYWVRRRILFQWLRKVERSFGVPGGLLLFAAREERGEKNGRFHWHVLVGGLHHVAGRGLVPSPNPTADKFRLANLFRQCGKSAGIVDVRSYDARLSGVAYILKGLEDWSYEGANAYELAKFDESREGRELILAPEVFRHLALRSRNKRHQRARDGKIRSRDRSAPGVSSSVPTPARFPHHAAPDGFGR